MTTQQSFKRRIRARMQKTGESYTAARAQLLTEPEREHAEIAAWLGAEHGVPGWWAQGVTVEYEKARGLRPAGGDRDGTLNVSAPKTVAGPAERLFGAFFDLHLREEW